MKPGWILAGILVLWFPLPATCQQSPPNSAPQASSQAPEDPADAQAPPRTPDESSSRDTIIDLTPPHESSVTSPYLKDDSDVQEFEAWDPHRAQQDIEVADFYYKRYNYRGALDRYREALHYKPNDATATFGIAQCEQKLGSLEEARAEYEAYLKILPAGPKAAEAKKEIARLAKTKTGN